MQTENLQHNAAENIAIITFYYMLLHKVCLCQKVDVNLNGDTKNKASTNSFCILEHIFDFFNASLP